LRLTEKVSDFILRQTCISASLAQLVKESSIPQCVMAQLQ